MKRTEQREVELKEKISFINKTLLRIGFYENENDIQKINSMEDLRKLRDLLNKCDVDILDNCDGGISIFLSAKLVAEFLRPTYVLKKDPNAIDPRNQFYLEMHINTREINSED